MKKVSLSIIAVISSLFLALEVQAASATIKISLSSSKIVVGNTVRATVTISSAEALGSWEYSLNYDKSKLTLTKSDVDLHYVYVAQNSSTKTVSYSYTFKSTKSGTAEFYLSSASVVGWNENDMGVTKKNASVSIITQAQLEATYSKDNYLKSLTVEDQTLTPVFNKETLVYALDLEPLTASIKVIATKQDSRSSVEGDGDKTLTVGLNKIDIVVTSQSGNKRTYIINANVKELTPINVKINNEDYTVVRNLTDIAKPDMFTETTILIDGEEVPALFNELTKYTLVGLKDAANVSKLYLYNQDKNEYTLYQALNMGGISIRVLEPITILNNYKKVKETINEEKVTTLKFSPKSDYSLIYGLNLETNKENFYSFDRKDLTLQKYNQEEVKKLEKDANSYLVLTIIFALSSVILLGTLIMTLQKRKTKSIKKEKEVKKEEPKEKSKEKKEEPKVEEKEVKKSKNNLNDWFEG